MNVGVLYACETAIYGIFNDNKNNFNDAYICFVFLKTFKNIVLNCSKTRLHLPKKVPKHLKIKPFKRINSKIN